MIRHIYFICIDHCGIYIFVCIIIKINVYLLINWWLYHSFSILGATIGAGIFVITGVIAKNITGPALFISYILSACVCICCALCYAEFASISKRTGSAYSYTYDTLGPLMGWIIGWDLALEYGVSAATVAQGWSKYCNVIIGMLFGTKLPSIISQRKKIILKK